MGMFIEDAARAAGYSESYIHSKSHHIERRAKVGITQELERAGLTAKVQAQALAMLTQAKKNQVCDIYVQKDENGKWTINHNMSQFIEVEDNSIRLKTWEHISELKKQTSNVPSIEQHITFAQFYRPEPYGKEQLETASRTTDRSL